MRYSIYKVQVAPAFAESFLKISQKLTLVKNFFHFSASFLLLFYPAFRAPSGARPDIISNPPLIVKHFFTKNEKFFRGLKTGPEKINLRLTRRLL